MRVIIKKHNLSIRLIIILASVFAIVVSVFAIGSLIFFRWSASSQYITEGMAENVNREIYERIGAFLHAPEHINDINQKLLSNRLIDLSVAEERDRYFTSVLSSADSEIYSFSFGTVNGEYYGARRNEAGQLEIMENNAGTGGESWYYAVRDDFSRGERTVKAGLFDPRTRAWYKAALEASGPAFSTIYKHFVMDDLAVSAAQPVYNSGGELQGVLGTHILLSGIGSYLKTIVEDTGGYACIVEKDTGYLIANSMGEDNFAIAADGSLKRYSLHDIAAPMMRQAYDEYLTGHTDRFQMDGKNGKLYVDFRQFQKQGVNWLVISAVPVSMLMEEVGRSIRLTVVLVLLAMLLSAAVCYVITSKLFRPMDSLLKTAESISAGNLSDRAETVRNDEIGKLSGAFNRMADTLSQWINNLENTVSARTEDLEASKDQLRLLLDSAGEAIYGVDVEGRCTFCNTSCLRMLGYSGLDPLLGKNMHRLIHHTRADATPYPEDECKMLEAIRRGEGIRVDDEIFWKADGTSFTVEYHAFPQVKCGVVVGAVVTFTDITERRKREEEILYLSCHDTLTGLINRRCFEENVWMTDVPENLPLTVVFADINGLKMTNDVFGHSAGDALIKRSAEILRQACRNDDVVARMGGDEFVILLPKMRGEEAEKILSHIKKELSKAHISAVKCSISLGFCTKTNVSQSVEEVIANAEDMMYKDKTLSRMSVNKDIIDHLVTLLHKANPEEKRHALAVSRICGDVGAAMKLPDNEISRLRQAGYLHNIGKVAVSDPGGNRAAEPGRNSEMLQQHAVVGYRILNLLDDMLDLAEGVYSQHERWDGKGYPKGLAKEEIPLVSRIISAAEAYDRVFAESVGSESERRENALRHIREGADKQFDPQIVEIFAQMAQSGRI